MTAFEVLDQGGQKVAERELPAELFEAPVSVQLMHQVVVAGMASLRRGTHSTKGRGEVSGGGRKPWRQKGTGRARQGSNRAPQWTGGGVVHGPQPRSHAMRVNKKMKKGALRSALTDALQSGKLVLVDDLRFDEPKTKRAAEVMDALELVGKTLLVLPGPTEDGTVEKSFRNLPTVRIAYARSLGVYDVVAADKVVLTGAALDALQGAEAAEAQVPEPAKTQAVPEARETEPAETPTPEGGEAE